MKVKSVSDCLNIIDDVMVENIGKYIGTSILENIHKHLLENGQTDFIEDRVALSNVLGQINSMIKNQYQSAEEDIKSENIQMRKLILVWLVECATESTEPTEPEVDNQH